MSTADPYGLLGLDPDATDADIRRAFRRLARRSHPDAGGDPARFVALRQAHDLLTDPAARARFDASRHAPSDGVSGSGVGRGRGVRGSSGDATVAPVDRDERAERAALRSRWPSLEVAWRLDVGEVIPLGGDAGFAAVRGSADGPTPAVVAVSAVDGAVRWRAGLAAPAVAGMAVLDGRVIVASSDGVVHGLDQRDGTTRWERRLATEPRGVVVCGDGVLVAAADTLTAIGAAGEVRWVARPHGGIDAAVAAGPVVVMRTGAGAVVGVDPRTGATRWWLRSAAPWGHLPVMAGSLLWLPGTEPSSGASDRLVGVDPRTGGASLSLQCPARVASVHDIAGALVVCDVDGGVTAVRNGHPQWRMVMPTAPSAPLGVDGAVVVATADGVLRFLSQRHGTELHRVPLSVPSGGPASLVGAHDVVVVAGVDGGAVAHRVLTRAEGPSPR